MADQEWAQDGIFDAPHTRRLNTPPLRVEQPSFDAAEASPGPPPSLELQRFWADPEQAAAVERDATTPTDEARTIAQLGMALYLLQTLHGQHTPGLARQSGDRPRRHAGERGG